MFSEVEAKSHKVSGLGCFIFQQSAISNQQSAISNHQSSISNKQAIINYTEPIY
jgi:hypothetical protein